MPDASRPFGRVIVRNGGRLRLVNGATLKVTKGITVDSKSRLVASSGHVIELVGDEECTILGGAYMTIESLICTNAGKKVMFGTSSADKITIANGKTVRFCGAEAKSATRLVVRDLELSDATAYLKLYGSTVEVRQYMHKKGKGWYKDYEASQASGNLVLGTGGSVIWRATGGLQFLVR